jgi:hypothetical protein
MVAAAKDAILNGTADIMTMLQFYGSQYRYSLNIREDNTPEHAKYLGYLDARELYPDFQPVKYTDYVNDVVKGTTVKVFQGRFS